MFLTSNLFEIQIFYFLLLFQVIRVSGSSSISSSYSSLSSSSSFLSSSERKKFEVRLKGGRNEKEGMIEIKLHEGAKWRPVCGSEWNLVPATLICKSLDLGFAQFAISGSFRTHDDFSANLISSSSYTNHTSRQYIIKMTCTGRENHISLCQTHEIEESKCPGPKKNYAGVICNRGECQALTLLTSS